MASSIIDGNGQFQVLHLGGPFQAAVRVRERICSLLSEDVSGLPSHTFDDPDMKSKLWFRNGAEMASQADSVVIPFKESKIIGERDHWECCDDTPAPLKLSYVQLLPDLQVLLRDILAAHRLDLKDFDIVDCLLTRLLASRSVGVHQDASYGSAEYQFWQGVKRIHVPLKTAPGVRFFVAAKDHVDREEFILNHGFREGDEFHFQVGHAYQVNNLRFHAVNNEALTYRDHLIIDLRPHQQPGQKLSLLKALLD